MGEIGDGNEWVEINMITKDTVHHFLIMITIVYKILLTKYCLSITSLSIKQ
jgi:hypothetical protein